MSKICILTPSPTYSDRWKPDAESYRRLFGKSLSFRPWSKPGNLAKFDLVLPLLAWGYPLHVVHWFQSLDAWEAAGLTFANSIKLLRWNTDKDYLLDLEEAGVATVPTIETHTLSLNDLAEARAHFQCDTLIVKPSISAGAVRTYRLNASDPIPFDVLEREMLIQPLLPAIMSEGEYSLFYFGGQLSHTILKTPAKGDFRVQPQHGGREQSVTPPPDAIALAENALAAAPAPPLYARVDMVRGVMGEFRLIELELIEPALFLGLAADQGAAFADTVRAALASA
jgi:hypothetical protein